MPGATAVQRALDRVDVIAGAAENVSIAMQAWSLAGADAAEERAKRELVFLAAFELVQVRTERFDISFGKNLRT